MKTIEYKKLTFTRFILFFLVSSILIPLTACKKNNDEAEPVKPGIILTSKQKAIVNASNDFGIRLLKRINQGNGDSNLFISPLSVSVALGMTYNGADGNTREEMKQTLGFYNLSDLEINESYHDLMAYLLSSDPGVTLKIANSIWHHDGFYVLPDFIKINKDYFDAEVFGTDFSNPGTPALINQWVANHTNNKITQIISTIDPYIVMILLNAVYFKGDWKYMFKKENTQKMEFYPENGGQIQVDMMYQKGNFEYFENSFMQCLNLPYGDGRYSMVLMLPSQGYQVDDIIDQMDPTNWTSWLSSLSLMEGLPVYLPKFKFEWEKKLNDVLADLGMPEAFEPGLANFSKINPEYELYIDEVKHKTYVDVNEEGTEAAAVTSVSIGYTSMPPTFTANHPFLFVIREKYTGFIVFAGKVAEPTY